MNILSRSILAFTTASLSLTPLVAQGNFTSNPIEVDLIASRGVGPTYAQFDIELENLTRGRLYTVQFVNTYGVNASFHVTNVTPHWGPFLDWPFAPGSDTYTIGGVVLNNESHDIVFGVTLLDASGTQIDNAWVNCRVPAPPPGTSSQSGQFTDRPVEVPMIDPGASFGFNYAFFDLDLDSLSGGGLFALNFANTLNQAGLNVYVAEVTPYYGPFLDWPFAATGSTSHSILVMGPKTDCAFESRLLDSVGVELASTWVHCIAP